MNDQRLFEAEISVPDFGIVVIRIHFRGHFDEAVTYMLISQLADAEWCRNYCPDGKIDIGFGRGWLDDHVVSEANGKKRSCTMIVAKSFGVENSPDYKAIVDYAHFEDNNRTRHKDSIANLLWLMQQYWPEKEEENLNWALQGLVELIGKGELEFRLDIISAKFDNLFEGQDWRLRGEEIQKHQQMIFSKALDEIELSKTDGRLILHRIVNGGKTMLAAAIQSDNPCMAQALRSKKGLSADIVVVRSSIGHNYVTADNRRGITLEGAAAVLRIEEQRVAKSIKVTDWKMLKSDGTLLEVPEWFYFEQGGMLMNGSLTRPEVPPSRLSLKKVLGCVVLALSMSLWHENSVCRRGSCLGRDCTWYAYGLGRCCARRSEYRRRMEKNKHLQHTSAGH